MSIQTIYRSSILALCVVLSGCASAPPKQISEIKTEWLDQEFHYAPSQVAINSESLFHLDPELIDVLHKPEIQELSVDGRIKYLIDTVLESKSQPFTYRTGHSTMASETWRTRHGDCLSLTVLSYAIARELQLAGTMQEVPVPTSFDRHDGVDYLQGHVNLYLEHNVGNALNIYRGIGRGVVIDFEPSIGSHWKIGALSEEMMLARYYNNLGAESYAKGEFQTAYTYYKLAMTSDPKYFAAHTNLAALYVKTGHKLHAEYLFKNVAEQAENPDVAIRGLYHLMASQGRNNEANLYRDILIAHQEQDPYFWIARGLNQYRSSNFKNAIDDLSKAQSLATGFSEIHVYLAMAYWHDGQREKAQEQYDALARINNHDPNLASLSRKFSAR